MLVFVSGSGIVSGGCGVSVTSVGGLILSYDDEDGVVVDGADPNNCSCYSPGRASNRCKSSCRLAILHSCWSCDFHRYSLPLW